MPLRSAHLPSRLPALLGFALLLLALAPGQAQRAPEAVGLAPTTKAHLDRGIELYLAGRHEEALQEFQAGYDLDPQPEFLYALGQATRAKGDCAKAVEYFRAFVRTAPPEPQLGKARMQIARCERLRLHAAAASPRDSAAPRAAATVTARPAATGPGWLHARVTALADVASERAAAELGLVASVAWPVDVGATAVLGERPGARVILTLHPPRRAGGPRLLPELEARALIHPAASEVALGGGLWLGGSFALGPGRVRAGVAGELCTAPVPFRRYAVIFGVGYEVDLLGRRR